MGLMRFVRIRGRAVWFALIALIALSVVPSAASTAATSNQPAGTSSFSLQFNSLPSAQGWTYFQGDGIPETSVFSVTGTSLIQDTIGIGEHGPNYAMFNVVDGTQPFQLTVRARILSYEGTGPFGFFFAVRTASPNQDYAIGLSPSRVADDNGNGVAIDTTTFHTYVLSATPGGPYTLDIDGHFALGGTFDTNGGALNAVQFGDGANLGPTNAQAEVTEFEFSRGPLLMAALGDSYSSGNGTPDESGVCVRSPEAWPMQVPDIANSVLPPGVTVSPAVDLLACSGATSYGTSVSGKVDLPAQITQLGSLQASGPATSIVTVTIGGDDGFDQKVGFRHVLQECIISSRRCARVVQREQVWLVNTEPALLLQDFTRISAAAPSAKVFAVGYPLIFFPASECLTISPADVNLINDLTTRLDADIQAAAASVPGVTYVNVLGALSGHEVCSTTPYVVAPSLFEPLHDWFHPNVPGQGQIAGLVAAAIVASQ